MNRRLLQTGFVVLVGAGTILLLRVGYGVLFDRSESPSGGSANPPVVSPAVPRTGAAGGGVIISSGRNFGMLWSLAVRASARGFCLELASAGGTTSSCAPDSRSLQVLQRGAGSGLTLLFGSLPRRADQVWMALQDGRLVSGSVFRVPESLGVPFGLYLLPVRNLAPGEVVAVDKTGLLVDHAHVSTSDEPGRPVGWLDAYGNLIGYVPIGDWTLPPPGRPARLDDIRDFSLQAPLTRMRPQVEGWWADRPGPSASPEAIKAWWSRYPLTELVAAD